ncbi:DUF6848 family protein [Deinococcus ruber]|uniref:DUF6848 domain-containing protein n=1 Tax=Deinococcus ruber TaxID=1848197 RepID=A0A918F4J5_9DEIO|nr:hypothetical protein [Deinococcus ruber]GGR00307.1 hypothetical protein GCM10008957_11340 [Deinococcus ruber]
MPEYSPEREDTQLSNQSRASFGGAHASIDGGNQPQTPSKPASAAPTTFAGVSKAKVTEWRSEYGDDRVKLLSVPIGSERQQFIVRGPSKGEYDRYLSEVAKSDRNFDRVNVATRNLFASCLLAPDIDTIRAIWERYPALTNTMTEPVMTMAGTDLEVREETF